MRVLSFIPAILLAAAGFVAAAPTTSTSAVTSCIPAVPGSDATLQPYITIIQNATAQIQPLSGQLTSYQSSPDVNVVSGTVAKITVIINATVAQLKAVVAVDLTIVDLTSLGVAIYALLALVLAVLDAVVIIVLKLGVNTVGGLLVVVGGLLQAVGALVVVLKIFVTGTLAVVLGPVLLLVVNLGNLLSVVLGLKITL